MEIKYLFDGVSSYRGFSDSAAFPRVPSSGLKWVVDKHFLPILDVISLAIWESCKRLAGPSEIARAAKLLAPLQGCAWLDP